MLLSIIILNLVTLVVWMSAVFLLALSNFLFSLIHSLKDWVFIFMTCINKYLKHHRYYKKILTIALILLIVYTTSSIFNFFRLRETIKTLDERDYENSWLCFHLLPSILSWSDLPIHVGNMKFVCLKEYNLFISCFSSSYSYKSHICLGPSTWGLWEFKIFVCISTSICSPTDAFLKSNRDRYGSLLTCFPSFEIYIFLLWIALSAIQLFGGYFGEKIICANSSNTKKNPTTPYYKMRVHC